jgi:hypothetical protein
MYRVAKWVLMRMSKNPQRSPDPISPTIFFFDLFFFFHITTKPFKITVIRFYSAATLCSLSSFIHQTLFAHNQLSITPWGNFNVTFSIIILITSANVITFFQLVSCFILNSIFVHVVVIFWNIKTWRLG